MILPGEFLATQEEYMAGEGTFVSNGKIYSAVCGEKQENKKGEHLYVVYLLGYFPS